MNMKRKAILILKPKKRPHYKHRNKNTNLKMSCASSEASLHQAAPALPRHLAPPITLSATYVLPSGEEEPGEPVYGRYGNPSRLQVATSQFANQPYEPAGGHAGSHGGGRPLPHLLLWWVLASPYSLHPPGMAAICAVLDTLVPGDMVVASRSAPGPLHQPHSRQLYGGALSQIRALTSRSGLE